MKRRAFLGAAASGGAAALGGCTLRRETVERLSAEPEIPPGEFYHAPLDIETSGKQFNLQYEVTADGPFDALLFGGQSAPDEFEVYRRAVGAADGGPRTDDGVVTSDGGGDRGPGRGPGGPHKGCRFGNRTGAGHDHHAGSHADCPHASDWHSVVGAQGRGEVNRPLRPGQHHFVVDNTTVGEATPDGPLHPTIDLQIRDFDPL
jgi:hypothetical protein